MTWTPVPLAPEDIARERELATVCGCDECRLKDAALGEIAALRSRVETLEGALRAIEKREGDCSCVLGPCHSECSWSIARAALASTKEAR